MSTMQDADPTAYAPRADELTIASAWSSSPLGDPGDEAGYPDDAGYSPYRYDFPPDPITPPAKLKSISKGALVGGLVGTIGVGAALGMALFGNWTQPRPVSVVPGSTGVPAAVPAAGTPAPVINPPDNGPAPAPLVTAPANGPAPAPMVTPPDNGPAPAPVVTTPANGPAPADPGSPPDLTPPGPIVTVNVPPPPAVSVSVQPPQLPPLPSLPPLPPLPTLPPPPPLPTLCLPPHHLVHGVCQ
jgi:hypothetical protein